MQRAVTGVRSSHINLKHGHAVNGRLTAEYRAWQNMHRRCKYPSTHNYADYGGHGIRVCERWSVFANFIADMGTKPSPKHSIDRFPDNDGNYEPSNCRWATASEQRRNQRRSQPLNSDHRLHRDGDF